MQGLDATDPYSGKISIEANRSFARVLNTILDPKNSLLKAIGVQNSPKSPFFHSFVVIKARMVHWISSFDFLFIIGLYISPRYLSIKPKDAPTTLEHCSHIKD